MIGAALVSHGQDLAGTPPAEVLAACGFILSTVGAAIARALILWRSSST